MEYAHLTPQDRGFNSEEEELESTREYVQNLMRNTEPGDLVDSVLILANICENRALLSPDSHMKAWHERFARILRGSLDIVTHGTHSPKAHDIFEHQYLYYPDVEKMH